MPKTWVERYKFAKTPTNVLMDRDLSDRAKVLYAYLSLRAGKRRWFYPQEGQGEIASEFGWSESKVRRAVSELVSAGHISLARVNHRGVVTYTLISGDDTHTEQQSEMTEHRSDMTGTPVKNDYCPPGAPVKNDQPNTLERTLHLRKNTEERTPPVKLSWTKIDLVRHFKMGFTPERVSDCDPKLVDEVWREFQESNATSFVNADRI